MTELGRERLPWVWARPTIDHDDDNYNYYLIIISFSDILINMIIIMIVNCISYDDCKYGLFTCSVNDI